MTGIDVSVRKLAELTRWPASVEYDYTDFRPEPGWLPGSTPWLNRDSDVTHGHRARLPSRIPDAHCPGQPECQLGWAHQRVRSTPSLWSARVR